MAGRPAIIMVDNPSEISKAVVQSYGYEGACLTDIDRITQLWVRQLPTGALGPRDEASLAFACGLLRALKVDCENDKQ